MCKKQTFQRKFTSIKFKPKTVFIFRFGTNMSTERGILYNYLHIQ